MRAASDELKAFLASRQPCYKADLFTFTLIDGSVYRWSTFDQDIKFDGDRWLGTTSASPLVSRSALGVRNTMEIPKLTLTLQAPPGFLIAGVPIRQQIMNGFFEGSLVRMDRAFMPKASDTAKGLLLMFLGGMSDIKMKADLITMTVKGGNSILNQPCPKNVYQTSCPHTFCDAGCALLKASFTIAAAVGSGSTPLVLTWASAPGNATKFSLGKITMTSGESSGETRSVKSADSSGILISYPFDGGVAPGDTFSIMQGCDKTQTRCDELDNLQHYRGFPYIPQAVLAA